MGVSHNGDGDNIAVLGSHPATVWMAPFDDPDWQIWACSPDNFRMRELPRVDEWFELHNPARDKSRPDAYLEYVRVLSSVIPVWMRDRRNHPRALDYPDEVVIKEFGSLLLTSSIARILAKAIMAQPKRIGLFGILQASQEEFSYQRDGTRYFLEEAHRRGIEIVLPKPAVGVLAPVPDNW